MKKDNLCVLLNEFVAWQCEHPNGPRYFTLSPCGSAPCHGNLECRDFRFGISFRRSFADLPLPIQADDIAVVRTVHADPWLRFVLRRQYINISEFCDLHGSTEDEVRLLRRAPIPLPVESLDGCDVIPCRELLAWHARIAILRAHEGAQ